MLFQGYPPIGWPSAVEGLLSLLHTHQHIARNARKSDEATLVVEER